MVKRVVAAFMYEVFEIVVFEYLNKIFSVLRPTFVEVIFFRIKAPLLFMPKFLSFFGTS